MAVLRDMLNIGTQANLYNYVMTDEAVVTVFGISAWGDTPPKYYRWDVNSTETDDGENVIQPNAIMGAGRYLKLPVSQTQVDWNQASSSSMDFIKNKPTIPADQVNSDWNAVSGSAQILNKPTIPFGSPSINNSPSVTIQTVAAAANGNQLSTTRHAIVNYSVTITSATQIGVASNVTGYVVLEIAATNSTTAGDWVEIGRIGNGQNIGLAVALSLTTTTPGQVGGVVPAGWYRRLRSVNTSGTPTYGFNTGQEVLI